MYIFTNIYRTILEAIFPISQTEKEIANLSREQAYVTLPRPPKIPIDHAFSVFAYKDERVAKLVWNIKYKKSEHCTKLAGFALYSELLKIIQQYYQDKTCSYSKIDNVVVIPIPITSKRRRERGYNQCELITREMANLDLEKRFIFNNNLLIRTQHLSRQTLKKRSDRIHSAKDIFSVNEEVAKNYIDTIKKCLVIIIDDVITTGSTMNEALATMKNAGFENVIGLSIAH